MECERAMRENTSRVPSENGKCPSGTVTCKYRGGDTNVFCAPGGGGTQYVHTPLHTNFSRTVKSLFE